jgi:hypothetical protein
LIVGVACSSEGGQGDEPALSSSTSTASPGVTAPAADCDLGTVPAGGEITYVEADRLYGVTGDGKMRRCLASDAAGTPQWNGIGTRVFFEAGLVLSRPEGKSVLRIDAGRLFKRSVDGGDERNVSFLDRHDAVVYHPAGRHIASVGLNENRYGIYVATNEGEGRQLVTDAENASELSNLQWTESGALAFSAFHDGVRHVHRLDLSNYELSTVDESVDDVSDIAASRFEGAGLAWAASTGSKCSLAVNRGGRSIKVPEAIRNTRPVGWLPEGLIVVRGCEPGDRGDVSTLNTAEPSMPVVKVAERAAGVAVRAELPRGPALQLADQIESEAPA